MKKVISVLAIAMMVGCSSSDDSFEQIAEEVGGPPANPYSGPNNGSNFPSNFCDCEVKTFHWQMNNGKKDTIWARTSLKLTLNQAYDQYGVYCGEGKYVSQITFQGAEQKYVVCSDKK